MLPALGSRFGLLLSPSSEYLLHSNLRKVDPGELTVGTVGVVRFPPSSAGLCGQAALRLSFPTQELHLRLRCFG